MHGRVRVLPPGSPQLGLRSTGGKTYYVYSSPERIATHSNDYNYRLLYIHGRLLSNKPTLHVSMHQ
ncbi:Protein of unknown function [Pyronema omphalodes CBS 100304]|uniref:Uncharacterized protein n=1 Tax=Pyronema omphalodes (strain CBS 100304) TaxID=1076935 RepID=U4LLE4_PYROM|nr:Protein of unknown function [Pyronema omphalodes CBS 100304]